MDRAAALRLRLLTALVSEGEAWWAALRAATPEAWATHLGVQVDRLAIEYEMARLNAERDLSAGLKGDE